MTKIDELVEVGPGMTGAWDGAVGEAIAAVRPLADHLHQWLIDEVGSVGYVDRDWINGVLKEAVAEQRPDIPMTWLDERLPTKYPDQGLDMD